MPPFQKLYIFLAIGVGVSAVTTALPFEAVYAALFLFGCGGIMWWLGCSHKELRWIIGISVLVITVRLGMLRYVQLQAQQNIGNIVQGIAYVDMVQEKEKNAEVVVTFEKNNLKVVAPIFGKDVPIAGSQVSAFCVIEKIPENKEIPFEKIKAVHEVFVGCKKFAWSVVGVDSWKYKLITYKNNLKKNLGKNISQENSFLLDGMVFGDDAHIAKSAQEDFKKSGISHILAVSGFNIALFGVWGLSLLMWWGVPRRVASMCMILVIIVFVEMVGSGASILRAAIMGCIPLLGSLLYRSSNTKHIFLVTVAMMIGYQPYSLWYDVGFQLSVLATAGLIYLSPLLSQKISRLVLRDNVIIQTLSATIATAPVLLWHFKSVSLLGLCTNLLVAVPVMQIMALAVVRLVTSSVGLGDVFFAKFHDWLLSFLYYVANGIAQYDYVRLDLKMGVVLCLCVVLLFGVRYGMKRKRNAIKINNETWYIITV